MRITERITLWCIGFVMAFIGIAINFLFYEYMGIGNIMILFGGFIMGVGTYGN